MKLKRELPVKLSAWPSILILGLFNINLSTGQQSSRSHILISCWSKKEVAEAVNRKQKMVLCMISKTYLTPLGMWLSTTKVSVFLWSWVDHEFYTQWYELRGRELQPKDPYQAKEDKLEGTETTESRRTVAAHLKKSWFVIYLFKLLLESLASSDLPPWQYHFVFALHCSWHAVHSKQLTNVLNKWPTVSWVFPMECWRAICPQAHDPCLVGLGRPRKPPRDSLHSARKHPGGDWGMDTSVGMQLPQAAGVRDHSRRQEVRECLQFGEGADGNEEWCGRG